MAFENLEGIYLVPEGENDLPVVGINYKRKITRQRFTAAHELCHHLKDRRSEIWVEYHKGWEVVQDASNRKKEKIVQRIIHFSGLCYIQTNNLAMSCEPDEGRGPVDFKVSRGQDITIIEVKLSTNQDYLHGYETQLEEYGKAEDTQNMIYVFIDLGNPGRRKRIEQVHAEDVKQGKKVPEVIIIDAIEKASASVMGKIKNIYCPY